MDLPRGRTPPPNLPVAILQEKEADLQRLRREARAVARKEMELGRELNPLELEEISKQQRMIGAGD